MSKTMNFGMFSEEGNKAVTQLFKDTMKLPISSTESDIYAFMKNGFENISKTHKEVYDTDVRERFVGEMEKISERKFSIYFL